MTANPCSELGISIPCLSPKPKRIPKRLWHPDGVSLPITLHLDLTKARTLNDNDSIRMSGIDFYFSYISSRRHTFGLRTRFTALALARRCSDGEQRQYKYKQRCSHSCGWYALNPQMSPAFSSAITPYLLHAYSEPSPRFLTDALHSTTPTQTKKS